MNASNTSSTDPSAEPSPRPVALPALAPHEASPESVAWAGSALLLTVIVGAMAMILGVLVVPGMRGIASQGTMDTAEVMSAMLSFTFAALLVALICGGSFELARVRKIGAISRGTVVAISGLIVALASPAVVQRLHPVAAIVLALVSGLIALIAGVLTARVAQTRILGATLCLVALSGLLRPMAWSVTAIAGVQASLGLYHLARALTTVAVIFQVLSRVLAAAWLGTRSPWRGRLLANGAIIVAFAITYLALRDTGEPQSAVASILHASLAQSTGLPLPYGLASIAAFLLPATILLALVAIVQRTPAPVVLGALGLALLSSGSFDVPLHALCVTAAAQWALLAMVDERSMWSSLVRARSV